MSDTKTPGLLSRALLSAARIAGVLSAISASTWWIMIRMPGTSYAGALPPATPREISLAAELRRGVVKLASEIGERNVTEPKRLAASADWLESELTRAGYAPKRQTYEVTVGTHRVACSNIEVEVPGDDRRGEIVVVGGHYDSALFAPGADDNATGASAVLALAHSFAGKKVARTLRFVEFVNEEPPSFKNPAMGSLVYAQRCKQRGENVVAMLSLESMGYFSDAKGSQKYQFPFGLLYPTTGDFIAFVGDISSRDLVHQALGAFRSTTQFPSEGAAPFGALPGVGWSDHWAFWEQGYRAIMVTDTALFRNPNYHTWGDTPDTVDVERLARVVEGLERVVADIVSKGP